MGLSLPLSTSVPDSAESGCSSCSTPLYDQVSKSVGLCGVGGGGGAGRGLDGLCQGEYRERLQLYLYLRGHGKSLFHSEVIGWG